MSQKFCSLYCKRGHLRHRDNLNAKGSCRECMKIHAQNRRDNDPEYYKRYIANNKDKKLAASRRHRELNRDRLNAQQREYRAKHPEINKKWRASNKDKVDKARKTWEDNNKQAVAVARRRRRVALRNQSDHFAQQEWNDLVSIFDHRCLRCLQQKKLEVDHIIPVSKGGLDTIDNVQPLCRSCNAKKSVQIIDYRVILEAVGKISHF